MEQDNVDIRIATGEALALCYELARNYRGENWEGFDDEDEILYALEDLAKGNLYSGKKHYFHSGEELLWRFTRYKGSDYNTSKVSSCNISKVGAYNTHHS